MHPFVPEEPGDPFDVEVVLRYGSLPIVWGSNAKHVTLSAYARLYLKEEIQAEAIVRNLPGFARFLPIAALFHGQTINVTHIAREAGVARTTRPRAAATMLFIVPPSRSSFNGANRG